jgi:protein-L-isoaspartate(D-aspartate) O-methyltransferase
MRPSYEDTIFQQEVRHKMVAALRKKGITDESVLAALDKIPRHLFMREEQRGNAYVDKAFPIGEGQTISQPFTVAWQTQILEIEPGNKVLEVGTGSAYQACVLAAMGTEVYSIERQKKLVDINRNFVYLSLFPNLHLFYGDGYQGLPQHAPFDKIIVTAAAPEVPEELVRQLNMPGMMVLPLGTRSTQVMLRLSKLSNGELVEEEFGRFSFVPMLRGRKE